MKEKIKKQVLIVLLLIIWALPFFGQGYKIKVEIKGAAGLETQLAYYQGDAKLLMQTGKFDKNNKFTFEGKEKLPVGIYFITVSNLGYFDLLIRNEPSFSIETDTTDFIKKIKVKDSKENALFFAYQKKVLHYKIQIAANDSSIKRLASQPDSIKWLEQKKSDLNEELNKFVDKTKEENPESYLTKILSAMDVQSVENFNFTDEELLRTPFYHNYIRLFIKKNIEKNSAYIIHETAQFLSSVKTSKANYEYCANYLLNFYNTFYKIGMNEVFVYIADNYFLPDKANWFGSKELEQIKLRRDFLAQSLPGNTAQDLILKSSSGEFVSLLKLSSNYTLLYFWSVGCGHCAKSTKILQDNYQALTSKGIEIYAVNIDKNEEDWHKKLEENELTWINCIDKDETSNYRDKYYVYGSPLLYIIDSDKKIVAVKNGEVEIENAVLQLLK